MSKFYIYPDGWFVADDTSDTVPNGAVEVTGETWQDGISNPGKYSINDGACVAAAVWPPEPETQIITPEVDQEKADLWEAILALTEKIEALEGGK